jgi:Tol biopolymer transport system component
MLMRDDHGVVQLWTISPNGGEPRQLTHNDFDIASAFTWSPDGRFIAHTADNSVFVTNTESGRSMRLTEHRDDATAPLPQACVFSPDGSRIAYVRLVGTDGQMWNQIFVVNVSSEF